MVTRTSKLDQMESPVACSRYRKTHRLKPLIQAQKSRLLLKTDGCALNTLDQIHVTCDRLPAADLQPSRHPSPDNGNGCISGINPTHAMQLVDDGKRWHEQRRLRSQASAKICFPSSVLRFQQGGAARNQSPCCTRRKGDKATWILSVLQHWPTSEPSCLAFQRLRKRKTKTCLLLMKVHSLAKRLHMPNVTRDTQLLSSTNSFSRILLCRCLHGSHPPSSCSQNRGALAVLTVPTLLPTIHLPCDATHPLCLQACL